MISKFAFFPVYNCLHSRSFIDFSSSSSLLFVIIIMVIHIILSCMVSAPYSCLLYEYVCENLMFFSFSSFLPFFFLFVVVSYGCSWLIAHIDEKKVLHPFSHFFFVIDSKAFTDMMLPVRNYLESIDMPDKKKKRK